MQVMRIFLIVTVAVQNYDTISGAPLTKWFKTDNSTYFIEVQEKYTWQQSFDECQRKNMILIPIKVYQEDELLLKYINENFDPKPEFWLNANHNLDLKNINDLLGSLFTASILNIKLEGINDPKVLQSNNPNSCALTVDGIVKACDALHGYICHLHDHKGKKGDNGQNVQNIVLKFN